MLKIKWISVLWTFVFFNIIIVLSGRVFFWWCHLLNTNLLLMKWSPPLEREKDDMERSQHVHGGYKNHCWLSNKHIKAKRWLSCALPISAVLALINGKKTGYYVKCALIIKIRRMLHGKCHLMVLSSSKCFKRNSKQLLLKLRVSLHCSYHPIFSEVLQTWDL